MIEKEQLTKILHIKTGDLCRELYEHEPMLSKAQFLLHIKDLLECQEANLEGRWRAKLKTLAYEWDGRADSELVGIIDDLSVIKEPRA